MNLYVFSIGGSGVRVLHSLTMLLAAGIKMQSAKVIPVIIDTDEKNGNTNTTLKAIENYRIIYNKVSLLNGQETELNKKKVAKTSVFATEIDEPRIITISGTNFGDLKSVIGKNATGIDAEIKKFISVIYNDIDLDMPLTYGFIGHPNVGSIVLNYLFEQSQKDKNKDFSRIVEGIGNDDKILLIGSIFGGTGAAGFPLLLNIFNNSEKEELNKKNRIKGALSLTPYYLVGKNSNDIGKDSLDSKEGKFNYSVNSASFDSKTIAAQLYYNDYINKDIGSDIDAMYYVGDNGERSQYENNRGGEFQNNPAHIVELQGALCITHFDNKITKKGNNEQTQYADLTLTSSDSSTLTVGNNDELRNSLIRLWMSRRFFISYLPEYVDKNPLPTILQQIGYDKNEYTQNDPKSFSYNLKEFLEAYKKWAEDLEDSKIHKRRFEFVDTNANNYNDELIHKGFKDYVPKTERKYIVIGEEADIISKFLSSLNKIALKNIVNSTDVNSCLVRFVSQVIDDIITTKMK